ncbi:hypothetical protein TNCV_1757611 [Trichonephila clavipes]|nr:hypothetical protein TNCV_1757611 [Trichonephila clavipes]
MREVVVFPDQAAPGYGGSVMESSALCFRVLFGITCLVSDSRTASSRGVCHRSCRAAHLLVTNDSYVVR